MPSGPIGSCWAEDTWLDTAWEANTWTGSDAAPVIDVLQLQGTDERVTDILATV